MKKNENRFRYGDRVIAFVESLPHISCNLCVFKGVDCENIKLANRRPGCCADTRRDGRAGHFEIVAGSRSPLQAAAGRLASRFAHTREV